jgi:hypothetical protein
MANPNETQSRVSVLPQLKAAYGVWEHGEILAIKHLDHSGERRSLKAVDISR